MCNLVSFYVRLCVKGVKLIPWAVLWQGVILATTSRPHLLLVPSRISTCRLALFLLERTHAPSLIRRGQLCLHLVKVMYKKFFFGRLIARNMVSSLSLCLSLPPSLSFSYSPSLSYSLSLSFSLSSLLPLSLFPLFFLFL